MAQQFKQQNQKWMYVLVGLVIGVWGLLAVLVCALIFVWLGKGVEPGIAEPTSAPQLAEASPGPTQAPPTGAPKAATPVPQFQAVISPENVNQLTRLASVELYAPSLVYSPDGRLLAVANYREIILLDVKTLSKVWRQEIRLVSPLWRKVMAFSPDGQVLAVGEESFTEYAIGLRRVTDGALLHTLVKGKIGIGEPTQLIVAFSPDGQILASGKWEKGGGTVQLWRASDRNLLRTLKHAADVSDIIFSPDGQILAAASGDSIRLWRVSDGTSLRTLEGHLRAVSSVAFSPDGQILASGSWDGTVRLWRVSDGNLLGTLQHRQGVSQVIFSPNGRILGSLSEPEWVGGNAVRLWRASDGSFLSTVTIGGVKSVAFSPDGQTLAAGGNYVELWGVR